MRGLLEQRFWAKVRVGAADECWPWTGARAHGYGRIRTIGKRFCRAHRLAYALAHGDPGPLLVCHRCDNPLCCNPAHLFLGTVQDNNLDRDAKHRARGRHGITPLSAVVAIKKALKDGRSVSEAAAEAGVSYIVALQIKIGKRHAAVEVQ